MGRFYVTTPIYYVNAAPHIGTSYTTLIGDALTRWHRLFGDDVHFLTGTDEHGLKIQRAAEAAGKPPEAFAAEVADQFKATWRALDIANDDFIRTTEPRHHAGVKKLLQACYDAGDIELGTYEGLYCVSCEAYYTENDLVDGNCPIHGRPVELVTEQNYFFKLSRYEQRLLDWYAAHPDAITPNYRLNETLGFIRGGLQDFSISRTSIDWGIPIPWDTSHVTYVWFDALANYITAVGYGTDDAQFAKWWPVDFHLIGKDILRFHCVYWPAMLLSAGIEPPRRWAVHGFLLVGGEKMSKTALNQIDPADLIADFGLDGFRYYMLAEFPFGPDGDLTYEGIVARYNADLANNLGNLLSRVATVVDKKCGGIGPAPDPDSSLRAGVDEAFRRASESWADVQPSDALEAVWRIIRQTNAYLEAHEPWKAAPGPALDRVMGDALEALRVVALLSSPAIPSTAQTLWERLGLAGRVIDQRLPAAAGWGGYPGGLPVTKGAALFPRK